MHMIPFYRIFFEMTLYFCQIWYNSDSHTCLYPEPSVDSSPGCFIIHQPYDNTNGFRVLKISVADMKAERVCRHLTAVILVDNQFIKNILSNKDIIIYCYYYNSSGSRVVLSSSSNNSSRVVLSSSSNNSNGSSIMQQKAYKIVHWLQHMNKRIFHGLGVPTENCYEDNL